MELGDRAEVTERKRNEDQHSRSPENLQEKERKKSDSLPVRVSNDTHLVPKQRIRLADRSGREEVVSCDGDVLKLEVFHSDEEQREMRSTSKCKERNGQRREEHRE